MCNRRPKERIQVCHTVPTFEPFAFVSLWMIFCCYFWWALMRRQYFLRHKINAISLRQRNCGTLSFGHFEDKEIVFQTVCHPWTAQGIRRTIEFAGKALKSWITVMVPLYRRIIMRAQTGLLRVRVPTCAIEQWQQAVRDATSHY